jgi:hypothetical protein
VIATPIILLTAVHWHALRPRKAVDPPAQPQVRVDA